MAESLVFALARVTIELASALTIGTGRGDDVNDSMCVTDANDLPAIPGTSLAGVLRAACTRLWQDDRKVNQLFGFQDRDAGKASRVEVSWGSAHDASNTPVAARMAPGDIGKDPVLVALRVGVQRDHVRIGHDGVAETNGKFDQLLVPAGARFSFELVVRAASKDEAERDLDVLLALLRSGEVRLGASTRRGHGAFKVVVAHARTFDLHDAKDRALFRELPRALRGGTKGLDKRDATRQAVSGGMTRIELDLAPQDYWIFGTGTPVRDEHFRKDTRGDGRTPIGKVPVTEARIVWDNAGRGSVRERESVDVLVPASGVKGALRHRTLFHARCKAGEWAPIDATQPLYREHQSWADTVTKTERLAKGEELAKRPSVFTESSTPTSADQAVHWLFGNVDVKRNTAGSEPAAATAGRVFLADLYLTREEARSSILQHVSLDRFTMGPMDGLLYDEAPIAGGPSLKLVFLVDTHDVSTVARESLLAALLDLAEGRLAIGAGANRGHGYFSATPASLENLRKTLGGAA